MLGAITASLAALAAIFTALTAAAMLRIQHRTFLEAARPEVLLDEWTRGRGDISGIPVDTVTFSKIRNTGDGPALRMVLNASGKLQNRPTHTLSTIYVPMLGQGEHRQVNGTISVYWNNVSDNQLLVSIEAWHWDRRNIRHVTTHKILIARSPEVPAVAYVLAPGVSLLDRDTMSEPIWRLKSRRTINRVRTKIIQVIGRSSHMDR